MLILLTFQDHNPYPQTPGNTSLIHILSMFLLDMWGPIESH